MNLAISAPQILIFLIFLIVIPIGIFVVGYNLGKKAGYEKALKKMERDI